MVADYAFAVADAFGIAAACCIATNTLSACTVSRTSCTRTTWAPCCTASTAAVVLGTRRSRLSNVAALHGVTQRRQLRLARQQRKVLWHGLAKAYAGVHANTGLFYPLRAQIVRKQL